MPDHPSMDQGEDIHICGSCKTQFTSLEAFLIHKRCGCSAKQGHGSRPALPSDTAEIPPAQPGAVVTSAATTRSSNTPPRALSVKQRRKPILLSPSAKVTKPAECPSSQPSDTNTSVGPPNDSMHMDSLEAPRVGKGTSATPPVTAGSTVRGTSSSAVRESRIGSCRFFESKGKQGSKRKAKCYKCAHEGCGFETAHLKDIIRHRRIHTGDKPFACSICERCFSRKDKLQVHVRGHSGHKPFACSQCPYAAVDGSSLKKHMRTHTKERPFKCQICPYASCNSSQLATHLRTHTGDTPFHCSMCSAKFKINTDLRRHERIHTGEKPFKCSHCPYASALNSNLKSHVKHNHFEEKKHRCPDCANSFCTKKQLRQHELAHSSRSPVKCPQCGAVCSSLQAYTQHECSRKETNNKCPHCSFTARYISQIPPHVRKSHPELAKQKRAKKVAKRKLVGQPSKAENKSKRKPRPSTVQLTGKKPFTCDKCQASFMRRDSLVSHTRQHEQVAKSMESTALAVLQLQELPTISSSSASTQSTDATKSLPTSRNQNRSGLLSELNPIAPPTDIEILLNVISSNAPQQLISSEPVPAISAGNLSQNSTSKITTKNQSPAVSNCSVACPDWTQLSASSANGVTANSQPGSLTVIQPRAFNGDTVTVHVFSHNAKCQGKGGSPGKAVASFNPSGQQQGLGQFPLVRNQLELPQPPTVPVIQPTTQQLAPTANLVRGTSTHIPVPGSFAASHTGLIPHSNRSMFPAPQTNVCIPSTTISHPHKVFSPATTQGIHVPHRQTVSSLPQSRLPYTTVPVTHDVVQSNFGSPRQPNTSGVSSVPPVNQVQLLAQQTVSQTGTSAHQPHSLAAGTYTTPLAFTPTNNVQTLTKFSSWNSQMNTTRAGQPQVHVMQQHQLQGSARQQPNRAAALGAAAAPPAGVRSLLLAGPAVPHALQGQLQHQQKADQQQQQQQQPVVFADSSSLAVTPLGTACGSLTQGPSTLNMTSRGVSVQGASSQPTHPGTTSSV